MAGAADGGGDFRKGGEGGEKLGVVGVGELHGTGEGIGVADDEVADEGDAASVIDVAVGAGSVTGDGDGAEAGKDFLFAPERPIDNGGCGNGAGATSERAGDATSGVGAADGVVDDGTLIDLVGVVGAGDDLEGVVLAEGGCGTGVIDVGVGEQEVGGGAITGDVEDFLDNRVGAA